MGFRHDFERMAVKAVGKKAHEALSAKRFQLDDIWNIFGVNTEFFIKKCLSRPVTLNFHPDRCSKNGRLVLENLLSDGVYLSQFHTGTSNGGLTAHISGERFLWEQRLFSGIYPADTPDRPKYGALNLFHYLDGASARFGSCYFVLNPAVLPRCTFAYGDSSSDPDVLCTWDSFGLIAEALLWDLFRDHRVLDWEGCDPLQGLSVLLGDPVPRVRGNLDFCIEVHIHGELSLLEDIDSLFLDESYRDTETERIAISLCRRYHIALGWIPKREIAVSQIEDSFRGPLVPLLAHRADSLTGGHGVMNAALIGRAAQSSVRSPALWEDLGDAFALFQAFKQLWHTVAFFGTNPNHSR